MDGPAQGWQGPGRDRSGVLIALQIFLRFRAAGVPPENGGKLLPGDGVYVAELEVKGGGTYGCISNIGTNPTVVKGTGKRTIESYVPGEVLDLYDREIEVRLLHFLREEKKFEDISQLRDQIAADEKAAFEWSRGKEQP